MAQGLHEDILSKRPDFSELTETASTLMGLVGEDEATALADRLQAATDRYVNTNKTSHESGKSGLLKSCLIRVFNKYL